MQQKFISFFGVVALGVISCLFLCFSWFVDASDTTKHGQKNNCFTTVRIDRQSDDFVTIRDIDNRRVLIVKFVKSERMTVKDSILMRDTPCQ